MLPLLCYEIVKVGVQAPNGVFQLGLCCPAYDRGWDQGSVCKQIQQGPFPSLSFLSFLLSLKQEFGVVANLDFYYAVDEFYESFLFW